MADKTYRYTFDGFSLRTIQSHVPGFTSMSVVTTGTDAEEIRKDITIDALCKNDLDSFMLTKGWLFKEEVV